MTQERITVTKYENKPEWDRLEIKGKWEEWTISGCSGNSIEIEGREVQNNNFIHLYLNQDELKQVIEFLQSKVIDKQPEKSVYPIFKDEWGDSDWRDTGEMGG